MTHAELIADAAAYGVDVNATTAFVIGDDELAAFVHWARNNRADLVYAPGVARRVLRAYAEATP